jgi:stalled ribosome alternative rescue factor ArfA
MRKRGPGDRRTGERRRNPIARALRDPLLRARREANRRRYSRKAKHGRPPDGDDPGKDDEKP